MSMRKFRVDDEVWTKAAQRATGEGTNPSALIRQWLEDYTETDVELRNEIRRDDIIRKLRQAGCSLSLIASVTDMSASGVSKALNRLER